MSQDFLQQLAAQLRQPTGEAGVQVGNNMNQGNRILNLATVEQLHIAPQDQILELGMGNGYFVKDILAAAEGVHYTGCDFSQTMIEQATQLNKEFIENEQANFVFRGGAELPFADQAFTKAFTVNTLYFWEDPAKELAEFHLVLKPGGQLLIAIRPKDCMEHYPFTRYGFTLYNEPDVRALLQSHGFKVVNVARTTEPDLEMGGQKFKVEGLIITAEKQ